MRPKRCQTEAENMMIQSPKFPKHVSFSYYSASCLLIELFILRLLLNKRKLFIGQLVGYWTHDEGVLMFVCCVSVWTGWEQTGGVGNVISDRLWSTDEERVHRVGDQWAAGATRITGTPETILHHVCKLLHTSSQFCSCWSGNLELFLEQSDWLSDRKGESHCGCNSAEISLVIFTLLGV